LYTSLNIVRVIISIRMKWTGRITRMGQVKNAYKALVVKPEWKKTHARLKNIRGVILKCILGR